MQFYSLVLRQDIRQEMAHEVNELRERIGETRRHVRGLHRTGRRQLRDESGLRAAAGKERLKLTHQAHRGMPFKGVQV